MRPSRRCCAAESHRFPSKTCGLYSVRVSQSSSFVSAFPIQPPIVVMADRRSRIKPDPRPDHHAQAACRVLYRASKSRRSLHHSWITPRDLFMAQVRVEIFNDPFLKPVKVTINQKAVTAGSDAGKRNWEQLGQRRPVEICPHSPPFARTAGRADNSRFDAIVESSSGTDSAVSTNSSRFACPHRCRKSTGSAGTYGPPFAPRS